MGGSVGGLSLLVMFFLELRISYLVSKGYTLKEPGIFWEGHKMKVIYITNPPDSRNIQDRDTRHGEILVRILCGSITPGSPVRLLYFRPCIGVNIHNFIYNDRQEVPIFVWTLVFD